MTDSAGRRWRLGRWFAWHACAVAILTIAVASLVWRAQVLQALIDHTVPQGRLVRVVPSPDGDWLARVYQDDPGGVTGDSSVLVEVRRAHGAREYRRVYAAITYDTDVVWRGGGVLYINGRRLDARGDTYISIW